MSPLLQGLQENYGSKAPDAEKRAGEEGAVNLNGAPRGAATSAFLSANQAHKHVQQQKGVASPKAPAALARPLQAGNILGLANLRDKLSQTWQDFQKGNVTEGVLNAGNTAATAAAGVGNLAAAKTATKFLARFNPLASAGVASTEGAHQLYTGKTWRDKALGGLKLGGGLALGAGILAGGPLLAAIGAGAYSGSLLIEHGPALVNWLRGR